MVGLSTAYHLADGTALDVAVLEKEATLAAHQSGRNSRVLHPGFNHEPGSTRAAFATAGTRRAKAFCAEHDVAVAEHGVVVVATDRAEERRLDDLAAQAAANGVPAEVVGRDRLAELEPHAAGRAALHCPVAASVDSHGFVHVLARAGDRAGVSRRMGVEVTDVHDRGAGHRLETTAGPVVVDHLVNAAGLGADRLAHAMGVWTGYRVVPFRGEYRELVPARRELCRSMSYPTPDPDLPFLGVHLTRRTDDRVIVGPNAVLAGGREAYGRCDVDLGDLRDILSFSGFWRLMASPRMLRLAATVLHRTYRHEAFVAAARELVPGLRGADAVDSYAGVRA